MKAKQNQSRSLDNTTVPSIAGTCVSTVQELVIADSGTNNNNSINTNKEKQCKVSQVPDKSGKRDSFDINIFNRQLKSAYKRIGGQDALHYSFEEITEIMEYFLEQRKQVTNVEHFRLTNSTMDDILYGLANVNLQDKNTNQTFNADVGGYMDMIDYYFSQTFDPESGKCDYSLAHFFKSNEILANCAFKAGCIT